MSLDVKALRKCARCGYDLYGEVITWEDVCPLEGMCTECGHEFEWKDVCSAKFATLAWLPEHGRRREFVRRLLGAGLRAFLPWRFWSRVRMEHRVSPLRLAVVLLVTPLLSALAWGLVGVTIGGVAGLIAQTTHLFADFGWTSGWAPTPMELLLQTLFATASIYVGSFVAAAVPFLLLSLAQVLLADTMKKAKVRLEHVERIIAYAPMVHFWSLLPAFVCLAAMMGCYSLDAWEVAYRLSMYLTWAALIAPCLAVVLWWGWASSRYLKLRHAWLNVIVLSFVTTLFLGTAGLVYCVINPDAMRWLSWYLA